MEDEVVLVAANDNDQRCCPVCGSAVAGKPTKIYCSARCKRRNKDAKYDKHANAPEHECEHCGSTFRRRPNTHDAVRFCSRACGVAAKAGVWQYTRTGEDRALIDRVAVSYRVARRRCSRCDSAYTAPNMIGTPYCSDECRIASAREKYVASNDNGRDRSPRSCRECDAVFAPEYGDRRRVFCSPVCAVAYGRKRAEETGARAANRLKRKMLERAATVERVNPIEVFMRDGWRCRLCGVRTPAKLRGTHDPRAPELDHILPISLGGEHSYRNVQCACRECNGRKGATPMGQMLLFG